MCTWNNDKNEYSTNFYFYTGLIESLERGRDRSELIRALRATSNVAVVHHLCVLWEFYVHPIPFRNHLYHYGLTDNTKGVKKARQRRFNHAAMPFASRPYRYCWAFVCAHAALGLPVEPELSELGCRTDAAS